MTRFCPTCEDYRETKTVDREETYTVRGCEIAVPVKATVCAECGESLGSDEQDQAILDTVHAEYRRQNDLLTPEKIKSIRNRYRLSQKSLAALLGMSEATMNRYENGGLQDQVHDNAIRACEEPEYVRDLLERRGNLLSDWQRRRVEKALAGQRQQASPAVELLGSADWGFQGDEVSDRTGYRRFDYMRFACVAIWFCHRLGDVSRTVINKLLFYSDFLNFRTATVSITGTPYRAAPYGPVPADYGILLDRMEAEGIVVCREVEFPNGNTGYYYQPGPDADSLAVELKPHEQRVLEHIAEALGNMTATEVSERSHHETAYLNTEQGKLISYQEAATLSIDLPES